MCNRAAGACDVIQDGRHFVRHLRICQKSLKIAKMCDVGHLEFDIIQQIAAFC